MTKLRNKIRVLLEIIRFGIVLFCSLSFVLGSSYQTCRHPFNWNQNRRTARCNLNDKLKKMLKIRIYFKVY
jgi:hypothetical protein